MTKKISVVAVDFDGTLVDSRYPDIGPTVPYALEVVKKLIESGIDVVIYTVRDGQALRDAEKWCKDNGLKIAGANYHPARDYGPTFPPSKLDADLFIDDKNLCTPLTKVIGFKRHCVDWQEIAEELIFRGIINEIQKD